MARPVNADASATKQRILESATLFFSEKGKKSSVRDIARGAGVSLGMVHHYFGSKDDLYGACIDAMYEELAELRAHLTEALGASSVETILEDAVRSVFRFARERRTTMRLMMRRVVSRGALDEGRADTFLLPFLEQASALVAAKTGRDPASLRLPLQSLVFLNGRYAIADTNELMLVTGAADPVAALQAVEDHLVDHAHQMLGI